MKPDNFNPSYLFSLESTWKAAIKLLESSNKYDEDKFIALWNDLDFNLQLAVLSYRWERPALLRNASEKLCIALLRSKYPYVRYMATNEVQFLSREYPSLVTIIEGDPEPLVRNAIYEFGYRNDFNRNQTFGESLFTHKAVQLLIEETSEKRRAILAYYSSIVSIEELINKAIDLTNNNPESGASMLENICHDISWESQTFRYKDEQPYIDYEYEQKRQNASNNLWRIASNLHATKAYTNVAQYIAARLPFPPDNTILNDLAEPVLLIGLEREDFVNPEFCKNIIINSDSISLVGAAVKRPFSLTDDEALMLSMKNNNSQLIDALTAFNSKTSPPHWILFNETKGGSIYKGDWDDIVDNYFDRISENSPRWYYLDPFFAETCRADLAFSLHSCANGKDFEYMSLEDAGTIPAKLIDLLTFRLTNRSRYQHLLSSSKLLVQKLLIQTDKTSIWNTYLIIKATKDINPTILGFISLVRLARKQAKDIARHNQEKSMYPDNTSEILRNIPIYASSQTMSYYLTLILSNLPAFIIDLAKKSTIQTHYYVIIFLLSLILVVQLFK